jgi:hypothetical protein
MNVSDTIERLVDAPYAVVDLFPRTVPPECAERYFAVERIFLRDPQHAEIAGRFLRFLLKLNCFYAFRLIDPETDGVFDAPDAEAAADRIGACLNAAAPASLLILLEAADALITLDRGDLYLTLYNPSPALLETVRPLAAAEGLFVRGPEPA